VRKLVSTFKNTDDHDLTVTLMRPAPHFRGTQADSLELTT